YILSYKNYEGVEHAMYRISEEEIAFMLWSTSNLALGALFARSKTELMQMASRAASFKKPLVVMICARTKREFEYKMKVMEKIIEETGGKDMIAKGKITPESQAYCEALRSMMGFHGFLATGSFQSSFGGIDSIAVSFEMVKVNIPIKKKYTEKKLLPEDKGESHFITTYEWGHYAHAEMPTMYNVNIHKTRQAMVDYFDEADDAALQHHFTIFGSVKLRKLSILTIPAILDSIYQPQKNLRKKRNLKSNIHIFFQILIYFYLNLFLLMLSIMVN
ncbi:MAG: hypothetical protein ACTSQS_18425, partial [Promethearchaeota archaeon]